MISRRLWISAGAAIALTRVTRPARAASVLEVTAPSHALAAIVTAEGGAAVVVAVDRTLGAAELRVGGAVHRLAGAPAGRPDFLDDARNAPRIGASVRKILAAARPDLAAEFDRNHTAWTHAFVRRVLAWNARLAASPLRGKRLINTVDRAAFFAWLGAVVDPAGQPAPAALARAPRDCDAPTLASYVAYVERLVASVA